ncbi:rhomboid protease GluP [Clostridium cavendishii DSM 21758]|uniref:Rhomboid protease GluP n=1 Tax=Clostridium cavendishii DSM 21758 TaxID=1121302 RepID=A0A1M6CN51_9CLOT|nr:hypothetical protein [Clostridium cavendishii]SHI62427.1 rhomboid protease GluP [Clostridium cavendishii DSM 21758]
MSKFQKDFFYKLINSYGFVVEQYSETEEDFLALKYIEDGIYSVIISKEKDQKINATKAEEYLNTKNKKFAIHNVILLEDDMVNEEPVNFNRIFINGHSGKILKYDMLSEPIVKIIANILVDEKKKNQQ